VRRVRPGPGDAHLQGEFAPELEHEITDSEPEPGLAEYFVVAGNGTNGIDSPEPATVEVPEP